MKPSPPLPHVDDAPEVLASGHLWLQEQVDGDLLRFTVEESGWIVFGDADRVYRDDPVPIRFRHAVRRVRASIDREALESAALDGVTFFGAAMHRRAIDYDWARTPSFLGFDVHAPDRGFLPPDVVERAFERLGLQPVNAFEKERPARHFSLDAYAVPDSAWYDGPPRGVVVRNKAGGRAKLPVEVAAPDLGEAAGADPEVAAERFATPDRIERVLDRLGSGRAGDLDAIQERVVETVVREAYGPLFLGPGAVDEDALVRAIEARTRRYLLEERGDGWGGAPDETGGS